MRTLLLAAFLLAACGEEPENIQTKAENRSRMLEERAAELTAEAENATASLAAPLENEAEALLNQANEAAPPDNAAANVQER